MWVKEWARKFVCDDIGLEVKTRLKKKDEDLLMVCEGEWRGCEARWQKDGGAVCGVTAGEMR